MESKLMYNTLFTLFLLFTLNFFVDSKSTKVALHHSNIYQTTSKPYAHLTKNAELAVNSSFKRLEIIRESLLTQQQMFLSHFANEKKNCKKKLKDLVKTLKSRKKDVENVKVHFLKLNKLVESISSRVSSSKKQIAKNANLLTKFQTQRCESNLIFIENLKQQKDALLLLEELKNEIHFYFKGTGTEKSKLAMLGMIELLSGMDTSYGKLGQTILTELETHKPRLFVNNYDNAVNKKEDLLHKKIGNWIEGIMKEFNTAKKKLEDGEIKASNDFAEFKNSTERESEKLKRKIVLFVKETNSLREQIKLMKIGYDKRKDLYLESLKDFKQVKSDCIAKNSEIKKSQIRTRLQVATINTTIDLLRENLGKLRK